LVELKFKPNPHFPPSSHEAAVVHAMEGVLWVNGRQKRLVEISGHLTRPVKFGGGLLGHLDAGGHFYVKQEEVQPGYWELAVLDVDMKGKALFFKTIGVQEQMKRSMFRRVRDDLTAAQGANLLYQQVRTTSKISFKTETGRPTVFNYIQTRTPRTASYRCGREFTICYASYRANHLCVDFGSFCLGSSRGPRKDICRRNRLDLLGDDDR